VMPSGEIRMRHFLKGHPISSTYLKLQRSRMFWKKVLPAGRTSMLLVLTLGSAGNATVLAQGDSLRLDRSGRTIVVEPYAPNIIRVTLSSMSLSLSGTMETTSACDEGMALLLQFADARPAAYRSAQQRNFTEMTHPMFDTLAKWKC